MVSFIFPDNQVESHCKFLSFFCPFLVLCVVFEKVEASTADSTQGTEVQRGFVA